MLSMLKLSSVPEGKTPRKPTVAMAHQMPALPTIVLPIQMYPRLS
jgi:hypothetical protein